MLCYVCYVCVFINQADLTVQNAVLCTIHNIRKIFDWPNKQNIHKIYTLEYFRIFVYAFFMINIINTSSSYYTSDKSSICNAFKFIVFTVIIKQKNPKMCFLGIFNNNINDMILTFICHLILSQFCFSTEKQAQSAYQNYKFCIFSVQFTHLL